MSRWLATAALLGCWGCAFSLDGPDPNRPRNRVPQCDTSKGLVALDGVMATALGVMALAATSESEPALALVPLGLGALYLGGAVSGNRAVNSCREAQDIYTRSYGDERMALSDGDEAAEDDDDDEGRQSRGKLIPRPRKATRGQQTYPQGPQGYPQQPPQPGYPQQPPQPGYPQQPPQPGYPQQPPPQGQEPQPQPQQPPPQQPPRPTPQQPPVKAKPEPAQEAGDGDWTDFWREVP